MNDGLPFRARCVYHEDHFSDVVPVRTLGEIRDVCGSVKVSHLHPGFAAATPTHPSTG